MTDTNTTARDAFIAELAELARDLIPTIGDDFRCYPDDTSDEPGMMVTIGVDERGWSYQTGDNSYTGGAYGYAHWGVCSLCRDDDPAEFARAIVEDLESTADGDTQFFFDTDTDI